MKRRQALHADVGLLGLAGFGRWPSLIGAATAQAPACSLAPQQAAGPFYFDSRQIRRDISEDWPGVTLEVTLQVVDSQSCGPVAGAL
jgi:protocatechuate 3,4-dioxygenase beta subunit